MNAVMESTVLDRSRAKSSFRFPGVGSGRPQFGATIGIGGGYYEIGYMGIGDGVAPKKPNPGLMERFALPTATVATAGVVVASIHFKDAIRNVVTSIVDSISMPQIEMYHPEMTARTAHLVTVGAFSAAGIGIAIYAGWRFLQSRMNPPKESAPHHDRRRSLREWASDAIGAMGTGVINALTKGLGKPQSWAPDPWDRKATFSYNPS